MIDQPFLESAPKVSIRRCNAVNDQAVFSIIIPTWNNLDYLKICIESLKKNSRFEHQIILHINEGSDGTRQWAESEDLDYTLSEANIGICYALNVARQLVRCDYLVYFNDDMYACPDWDFWLNEEIQRQTSIFFFLSSTMIEPKFSGNRCAIAPFDFGNHPENFQEEKLLQSFKEPLHEDWNGATWPPNLVPTLLWDMVGGYSTEFSPGMYSDPDFSMKLWNVGVRHFKGIAKSRIYHFMSKSTKKLRKRRVSGSNIFLNKWGISSNVFSRYYLRRGTAWKGNLTTPESGMRLKLARMLNRLKRKFI